MESGINAMCKKYKFIPVRDEDLKVGDTIKIWSGTKTIINIEPYRGPYTDIIFATCDFNIGVGMSLFIGGMTETLRQVEENT